MPVAALTDQALSDLARSCGAMVLGDEGTRQQYLFDLEQLGRLVALAAGRPGECEEIAFVKQVLEYEDTIRRALAAGLPADLATEAAAILNGRPAQGTRKDALREMAYRVRLPPPVMPPLPY